MNKFSGKQLKDPREDLVLIPLSALWGRAGVPCRQSSRSSDAVLDTLTIPSRANKTL